MDINIEELSNSAIKVTRVVCGVYFLFHCKNLVYIGKSKDIDIRIRNHIAENVKIFDSWAYIEVDERLVDFVEIDLIRKHKTKYNKCWASKKRNRKMFI